MVDEPSDSWIVRPKQVEAKLHEYRTRFPNLVDLDFAQQFVGLKIYAITITDKARSATRKKKLLVVVPHAHEPAGTAACMNFANQILMGKHLDGSVADLPRAEIFRKCIVTLIPDGNPDGRARSPRDAWEGEAPNEEFYRIMHGDAPDHAKFWPEHPEFDNAVDKIAHPGIVYEQISPTEYAEGNQSKRTALWRLVDRLTSRLKYEMFLNLHQGMENDTQPPWDAHDTWLEHPTQEWIPKETQEYAAAWAEDVIKAWERAGAKPYRVTGHYGGTMGRPDPADSTKRRKWMIDWVTLKAGTPELTVEVQNNSKKTPREKQMRWEEVAIRASVERLLKEWS
jgi:hypothetical protein